MPLNRKKSSKNKNKKKSRSQAARNSSNGEENAVQSSHESHDNASVLNLESETIPNIELFQTDTGTATRSSCALNNSSDSIYVRYKKSTQRFKEELQSMVPAELFQSGSVASLMDAADYVVQQGMEVKESLLHNLKLSIRVRKKVACKAYGGGDEGHSFFIAVLAYCWSVLIPLRNSTSRQHHVRSGSPVSSNRFANLFLSMEEDDEIDLEDDLPNQPEPRPVEESLPKRLSLQELLSATDLFDCKLFLVTLDELMGFNSTQFSKLRKEILFSHTQIDYPPSAIVEQLMETAVASNSAIQLVSSLEQQFIHENPHLNTVYRFLARLILSAQIEDLTKIVTLGSTNASMFTEHHAIEFLGDSLECVFRNLRSGANKKKSTLVRDFVLRWKLNDKNIIQNKFDDLKALVRIEVPLSQGVAMNKETFECVCQKVGVTSHTWLPHCFIGKERSILHTIGLLQGLSNDICSSKKGRLLSKPGSFGPQWGKNLHKPISKIAVEMDELLMSDIMPSLINMCSVGLLSTEIPREQELLPIFCQIRMFAKYPRSPVTWAIAFSVHSILTAIFEIHNVNNFSFVADTASQSFDNYFDQLEWARQREVTNMKCQPPYWESNLKILLTLRMITQIPMMQQFSDKQIQRAVWNPLCAGTFLSFISYYGNLDSGMAMLDSVAQLRAFLHLYNALIQMKAIKRGDVDLLDWLNEAFRNSKAIWEGPLLPELGKFQYRWWIPFGIKVEEAQRRCILSDNTHSADHTRVYSYLRESKNAYRRKTPLEPESLAKSYRRLCRRDYHDVIDTYHTESQKFTLKNTEIYAHAVRVNDTLDAMDVDQRFLATNWVCLGYYLNQYYISLFNVWDWMPEIDSIIQETPQDDARPMSSWMASADNAKYNAMSTLFAERVLGALDRGDQEVAWKCAEFLKMFFEEIPPDSVMWFVPMLVKP